MTKGTQGRFLLLYGSQTGQAKAIAEEIFENAPSHGLDPEMHCFSMTDKKFAIEKETCVVIVVSTTGEGDPPDTASKFWRRIKKKTLPSNHLSELRFTLLALGDSNYTNFCCNGKNFDRRLEELGASHFYPTGYADDATGLEIVAEPWLEGLYLALRKHLSLDDAGVCSSNCSATEANGLPDPDSSVAVKADQPVQPSMVDNRAGPVSSDTKPSSSVTETDASPAGGSSAGSSKDSRDEKHSVENSTEGNPGKQLASPSDLPQNSTSNKEASPKRTEGSSQAADTRISEGIQRDSSHQSQVQSSSSLTRLDSTQDESSAERVANKTNPSVEKDGGPGRTQTGGPSSAEMQEGPSLRWSVASLSESSLTLPVAPPHFLEVEFHSDQKVELEGNLFQGGAPMPSAASPVTMATLVSATRLTRGDAVKTALDMELDISESNFDYQPGDSFSIVCPNDDQEVIDLLRRLGLDNKADCVMSLKVLEGTKKRRAALPEHIPQPLCTLRHALVHCCDIRTPLKKAFLRALVDYTSDESEKRRLQELCSKQGASDYGTFIRDPHLSLLDVLSAFPSCSPPPSRLLEHLPRLQPRPYSISSSPLVDPHKIHFVFNVIVFPEGQGRTKQRRGVCTGWLSRMMTQSQPKSDFSLAGQMTNLKIYKAPKIPVFQRTNQAFHLPEDSARPIIMIGPGTGVAPFLGFLQHRECLQRTGAQLGPAWLFFGCRHMDRDFLYREALEGQLTTGVLTKLSVSFSRDAVPPEGDGTASVAAPPRYVQDNMKKHAAELCHWILQDQAVVYVCGDAKNMAKNVTATLSSILVQETGRSAYDAACLLATLREERRYLEDVWT